MKMNVRESVRATTVGLIALIMVFLIIIMRSFFFMSLRRWKILRDLKEFKNPSNLF
jgi:hypothetical protein